MLTIINAAFNNRLHTKATVLTVEVGALIITPAQAAAWADLLTWGQTNTITPYTPPPQDTPDNLAEALQDDQLLVAVVLAINDGTLVTGANKTPAQLKAIIKAHL